MLTDTQNVDDDHIVAGDETCGLRDEAAIDEMAASPPPPETRRFGGKAHGYCFLF